MRLDWQRRAVIFFAASLFLFCVFLVVFALREADREKLLKEREIEAGGQRLTGTINDRSQALIGEAEGRALEAAKQARPEMARTIEALRRILNERPLISEIFLAGDEDQLTFVGARPLYLFEGERPGSREIGRSLENDEIWKQAEAAEFRQNDPAEAASFYEKLAAQFADPALRALILNRLARCYAKAGQPEKAIAAYARQLQAGLPDLASEGIPFDISALSRVGSLHLQLNRTAEAAEVYFRLYQGLVEARWRVTRDQYTYFRKLAEDGLQSATTAMGAPVRTGWDGRIRGLKEKERERLARTEAQETVRRRILPRMRLEARGPDRETGGFVRIAEKSGAGLLLASLGRLDADLSLGLLFNPTLLARMLLETDPASPAAEKGLSVVLVDDDGRPVSGQGPNASDASEQGGEPPPLLTGVFADSFPPWSIRITPIGAGAAERQFRLRRSISVLSLAAVIAALFFGGFLAIRSTAKELRLAKLKSDFAATVSHEFRTPLTSIRYMAELLQRDRVPDEARRRTYFETISSESERLSRLVENLLDFSKIEAGMKEYRMEEADIAVLVADVAGRFRSQANLEDLTLEAVIAEDLPAIRVDKDAVGRAVFNLLDNAVKYSGQRPRVTLRVWSAGGAVHIQVEDRGMGIPKPEQKRIFQKFYRSGSAVESAVEGSGIGLPLVEHVVRAHGGKVDLESEPGQGTRVTIRLPVGRPED